MDNKRRYFIFLGFLLLSLVGNSIVDFSFIWLAAELSQSDSALGGAFLTRFYVGQAVGFIFLAPYFSKWLDQFDKLKGALFLDLSYVFVLVLVVFLYQREALSVNVIPFVSATLATLSSLHRNSVCFGVIKRLADVLDSKMLTSNFVVVFNVTLLLGASLAGVAHSTLGFIGSIFLAAVTFLPIMLYYSPILKITKTSPVADRACKQANSMSSVFSFVRSDSRLPVFAVASLLFFVPGAVFPGVLALFAASKETGFWAPKVIVPFAIVVGTVLIPFASKQFKRLPFNRLGFIAFLPCALCTLLAAYFGSYRILAVAFVFNCLGYALLNVGSVSLRVALIPVGLTAQGNAWFFGVTCIGQAVGAVLLLPRGSIPISQTCFIMSGFYFAGMLLNYFQSEKRVLKKVFLNEK